MLKTTRIFKNFKIEITEENRIKVTDLKSKISRTWKIKLNAPGDWSYKIQKTQIKTSNDKLDKLVLDLIFLAKPTLSEMTGFEIDYDFQIDSPYNFSSDEWFNQWNK